MSSKVFKRWELEDFQPGDLFVSFDGSEETISLVIDVDPVETSPALWKRTVTLLTNGILVKRDMSKLKSMVRWKEAKIVRVSEQLEMKGESNE